MTIIPRLVEHGADMFNQPEEDPTPEVDAALGDYMDIDRDLGLILSTAGDLHRIKTEVLTDADRGLLACRVQELQNIRVMLGDVLDVLMQTLGNLMEADTEPVPMVGLVSRGRSVSTKWDKTAALPTLAKEIANRLARDLETGEIVQLRANLARAALDEFLGAVSPPNPTVAGCKRYGLDVSEYRTITPSERWTIQIASDQ